MEMTSHAIPTERIVSIPVSAGDYHTATDTVMAELEAGRGGYVCNANVHMTMEAWDDPGFAEVVAGAFLVTSDGMPLVWMLRALGHPEAERVYGPTHMLHICRAAEEAFMPIALYGGTEESLVEFQRFLARSFPKLDVVCAIAPPFRPLTKEEDAAYTRQLVQSGARMVFVGIGCPKQERWMHAHTARIPGAMLFGVGAAFDFHSGRVLQAPAVLRRLGLEWLFRLVVEPKRLWYRYLYHNPRFMVLAGRQLLRRALTGAGPTKRRPPLRPVDDRAASRKPAAARESARTLDQA